MKVVGKQSNSRMCIICGMDNPIGLHAQFYNMEDGSVMTPFSYTENHQSFPQRVHGGLAASMLVKMDVGQIAENADPHEEMCYLLRDEVKEIAWCGKAD